MSNSLISKHKFGLTQPVGDQQRRYPDAVIRGADGRPLTDEEWQAAAEVYHTLNSVVDLLASRGLKFVKSFRWPIAYMCEKERGNREGDPRAMTFKGKAALRQRSGFGKSVVDAFYARVPADEIPAVDSKAKNTLFLSGGAECGIGRFAVLQGPTFVVEDPVTIVEARRHVFLETGLTPELIKEKGILPKNFFDDEFGEGGIRIASGSRNGLPVGGNSDDPEAMERCMVLALEVQGAIDAAHKVGGRRGVERLVGMWMRDSRALVTLLGCAKADFIKSEKAITGKARWYNIMGRQILVNCQRVTQALDEHCKGLADDHHLNSFAGCTLVKGGYKRLISQLERQLDDSHDGCCHIRMGDDSFVVLQVEIDGKVYVIMLSLDASNYDLTQHGTLTPSVHEALWEVLAAVDEAAATLLHCFWRKRIVIAALTAVVQMTDGGPSGLPWQTKVNGVLMGVFIERLLTRLLELLNSLDRLDETYINDQIVWVATRMGLTVRLEQIVIHEVPGGWENTTPIQSALSVHDFLFVGYNFYVEDHEVYVYCDVPRSLAQLRYPAFTWEKRKDVFAQAEAARLLSTLMVFGRPPARYRPAFVAARAVADALAVKAIKLFGEGTDPKIAASVADINVAQGALSADERSLKGLLAAFRRGWDDLWGPGHRYEPQGGPGGLSASPTTGFKSLAGLRIPDSTHPATAANAGRNPPTALWAAPKAPRRRRMHNNAERRRGRQEDEYSEDEWLEIEALEAFSDVTPAYDFGGPDVSDGYIIDIDHDQYLDFEYGQH